MEMKNTTYYRRKEQGLCVACGKELDRTGLKCTECLKKSNATDRETYHWMQENRICPCCRKEALFSNEKSCLECRARKTNNNAIRLSRNEQEIRKQIAIRDSNRYQNRKELGLCVACGKENNSKYAVCKKCRIKRNARRTRKSTNQIGLSIRKERVTKGLCYWCGNPVKKGYKVCEPHYNKIAGLAYTENNAIARKKLIDEGILY